MLTSKDFDSVTMILPKKDDEVFAHKDSVDINLVDDIENDFKIGVSANKEGWHTYYIRANIKGEYLTVGYSENWNDIQECYYNIMTGFSIVKERNK